MWMRDIFASLPSTQLRVNLTNFTYLYPMFVYHGYNNIRLLTGKLKDKAFYL